MYKQIKNSRAGAFSVFKIKLLCFEDSGQRPIVAKFIKTTPFGIHELSMPIKGLFRRTPDKKFGFINVDDQSIFVPPNVASILLDSSMIEGWAIRSRKKDGELSWNLLLKEQ